MTEVSSTAANDRSRKSLIGPRATQATTENIRISLFGNNNSNTTNQPAPTDIITRDDSRRMQSTTEYTRENNNPPVRHLAPTVVVQNNKNTIMVIGLIVFGIIVALAKFDPSFYSRRW